MNTQLLNAFLLATAQDPWEQWWNGTRLIFADWLEQECGKAAEARTLREMECVIADKFSTEGRGVHYFEINSGDTPRSSAFVRLEAVQDNDIELDVWERDVYLHLPTQGWVRRFEKAARIRISCRDLNPADLKLNYIIESNQRDGQWLGVLSLDRAQRRCRRRVIEMFDEGYRLFNAVFRQKDDSPRWVPFTAQPRERVPQDEWPEVPPFTAPYRTLPRS